MIEITVLGPGCANCKRLEQLARQAVENIQVDAEVSKIEAYDEIIAHGVMSTPGLEINGKLIASGRIPSLEEIQTWLKATS